MTGETIFAVASGAGRSGVAVMRLSGPHAGVALATLAGKMPEPRRAMLARLTDPASGEVLDDALVLWFPGPASFTGEDVAELHVHGGPAVIAGVIGALGAHPGLRPAEAGEFTRRAFENGKMDLTQAEGLADLVAAETATQRRQALRQAEGELAGLYESWRSRLIHALSHFEAAIDFADEENLPEGVEGAVRRSVSELSEEIARHLDDNGRGERLRDGFHVAILGAPNVGKSSLLNRLARRDAAIVSEIAGTTRDVIEVHLDVGGYPLILADTAGLRESGDAIETEGVARARDRAARADLRLVVVEAAALERIGPDTRSVIDENTLIIANKADLGAPAGAAFVDERPVYPVSAKTGVGLDALLAALAAAIAERWGGAASEAPSLTRARHRHALEEARVALSRFAAVSESAMAAEDLRLAMRAVGRITGRVDVEDLLDVIFRDFCIGK